MAGRPRVKALRVKARGHERRAIRLIRRVLMHLRRAKALRNRATKRARVPAA